MAIIELIKKVITGLPDKVKIGNVYVGKDQPVFVIAEAGINHNGDLEIAKQLIEAAAKSGANAIKFQKRTIDEILTKEGMEKPYNSPNAYAPTYGEHRKKLEFNSQQYQELVNFAKQQNILFFASVWDKTSADFMESMNIDAYKIPSADLNNLPLLEYVAKKNKPVLLSTGMSTIEEIDLAVKTILKWNNRLILFHCMSLYPSPDEKINLSFMEILRDVYKPLPVGYSGHEIDLLPSLLSVMKGACVIERHLTLDKTMKGNDHSASLDPVELAELCNSIKRIPVILGKPEKIFYDELVPMREKLAKSVVAKEAISKGEKISLSKLTVKGPGTGISPVDLEKLEGVIAEQDIVADTLLPKEALHWSK